MTPATSDPSWGLPTAAVTGVHAAPPLRVTYTPRAPVTSQQTGRAGHDRPRTPDAPDGSGMRRQRRPPASEVHTRPDVARNTRPPETCTDRTRARVYGSGTRTKRPPRGARRMAESLQTNAVPDDDAVRPATSEPMPPGTRRQLAPPFTVTKTPPLASAA